MEFIGVLIWAIIVWFFGFLVWPIVFDLFPHLIDKGYSISKILGLLIIGYVVWILGSFGYIAVTINGIVTALIIVCVINRMYWKNGEAFLWMRAHKRYVLIVEGLFVIFLLFMAYIRYLNPAIVGTEKPMEFAFMNSVLRGGDVPPTDPWFSGYGISYYYFGYVMMAVLTVLSGVESSVGFNLSIALIYGLAAIGSFGIAVNLKMYGKIKKKQFENMSLWNYLGALISPVFILLVGNLNGLFEIVHRFGVGSYRFWKWVDIKWIDKAPVEILGNMWIPERHWWWWQSSRVIRDRDLAGNIVDIQPITEFPFFSFLLGDLHPHVISIPFVLVAISVSLQLFLQNGSSEVKIYFSNTNGYLDLYNFRRIIWFGMILGSIAFINLWDYPTYMTIAVLAFLLRRERLNVSGILGIIAIVFSSIVLYLPFYFDFRSQANGFASNLVYPTRFSHLFVMFGVLLLPISLWIMKEVVGFRRLIRWRLSLSIGFGVLFLFILVSIALVILDDTELVLNQLFINQETDVFTNGLIMEVMNRRLIYGSLSTLFLFFILTMGIGVLFIKEKASIGNLDNKRFVMLLMIMGVLLVLLPEYFYVRDNFGVRMNTVFKFYYQAWILWSLVGGYGVWRVASESKAQFLVPYMFCVVLVVVGGLLYTGLGLWSKTNGMKGVVVGNNTLDGMDYIHRSNKDEYDAIQWISNNLPDDAVILESVGGSYTNYGRISANTGISTVLGWPGHEIQWRGEYLEINKRQNDIEVLYSCRDWTLALEILNRYGVKYVYIGGLERNTFSRNSLDKFSENMRLVYANQSVEVFQLY